jgi:uncharacterized protein YndB with AHSA1/START domain
MDLKYEFYIGGTPEQVWNVLVSPAETRKVYFGSEIRSTFEIGSAMEYIGPGQDGNEIVHIYGKVLEFLPHKVFTHTCNIGKAYTQGDPRFQESRVSYLLEPVDGCAKLTVIHDKWSENDPAYENTAKNWWRVLSVIKTLVETGKPLALNVH